jgi:hypothetical protein
MMAQLPYYQQIGDNLYADQSGKYFNIVNGNRSYVTSPYDTQTQKLNSIYDSQRKAQLDQLKAQRDRAIGQLNKQKTDLAPVYQAQRNQADVVNAQNVNRLRELMAANGINASGESLTTQANLASSRQNALNDINTQENQAVSAIDRQIADANDPSVEQAINNQIENARAQALLDAYNQYQQDVYNKAADWRDYSLLQQKNSGGNSSGGSSRKSSTKKATSSTSDSDLQKAYQEYQRQQQIQNQYAPTPFRATQTKPRQII